MGLSSPDLTKWIQTYAGTRGSQHAMSIGLTKLQGIAALRDARDFSSSRMMVGWGPGDYPGKQPSPYLVKRMESKGTLNCMDNVSLEVNVRGQSTPLLAEGHPFEISVLFVPSRIEPQRLLPGRGV